MTVEHALRTGIMFEQFLATHPDGLYALIHGEIVEKAPTQEHAKIAGIVLGELYLYGKQHPEIKAHLGPAIRYRPAGAPLKDRLPDVSVQLSEQPPVRRGAVAVEIKSPDDPYRSMRDKAEYYIQRRCALGWLLYPGGLQEVPRALALGTDQGVVVKAQPGPDAFESVGPQGPTAVSNHVDGQARALTRHREHRQRARGRLAGV